MDSKGLRTDLQSGQEEGGTVGPPGGADAQLGEAGGPPGGAGGPLGGARIAGERAEHHNPTTFPRWLCRSSLKLHFVSL